MAIRRNPQPDRASGESIEEYWQRVYSLFFLEELNTGDDTSDPYSLYVTTLYASCQFLKEELGLDYYDREKDWVWLSLCQDESVRIVKISTVIKDAVASGNDAALSAILTAIAKAEAIYEFVRVHR